MADLTAVLGAAGAGEQFESLGRTWTVMPPTQRTKDAYGRWMKAAARQEAFALKPSQSDAQYAAEQRRLDAEFLSGHYAYGGEVWRAVVTSDEGSVYLFYLCLLPNHREAEPGKPLTPALAGEVLADGGELARWAFQAAVRHADPSLFSPLGERPGGGKPTPDGGPPSPAGAAPAPAP